MCLVSVFPLSLTLHPVAKRARMQHKLVPNNGLEAKAEIKKLHEYCITYEDLQASLLMEHQVVY